MIRSSPKKLAWLIKQNKRYAPLLDTGLKLGVLLLPIGGAVSLWLWTIFSGYLGWLGQAPLPVTQAGDWLFLLAFGVVTSLIFTGLVLAPAAWTSMVQWNAPAGIDSRAIRQSCGASSAVTLFSTAAFLWWEDVPTAVAVIGPATLGGLTGGFVMTRYKPPYSSVLVACLAFAASSLLTLVWFSSLWILLASYVEPLVKTWPTIIALGLTGGLAMLLAAYIMKPALSIFAGLLIAGFWISGEASPEGGVMVATALYSADLGGGRPAHIDQSQVIEGEVCNLGVDARPVLVFETDGCERNVALKRVRSLKGLRSLDRKRILMDWRMKAEEQLHGSHG
ncbi:hypothetical protein BJF93_04555 [Xaviernesmea oryzae]|uniref:Uncharacterized protein n=1 Tax=Xaviernesmea oryzae TaxID=464029 RepID=A0A1Q9AUR3_9HYPH|nr:hypothetical protein [Xaviernesmea oryzae]OLP59179.1 hypothetical protein BJF93_04555 [Xaviernesmea oryzae]SEK82900.1 hypothetical protein SAMN04487976_104130 [Xaviernesmea oryzae]